MRALVRMRLSAFIRTQRAIAPLLLGLIVLGVLYGGGVARAEEAYGVSAVILFPVLAWQFKILLDGEPDVQRRLARIAAGRPGREIAAGLWAAAVTAVPTIVLALGLPWLFGGVGAAPAPQPAEAASLAQAPLEHAPVPVAVAIAIGVWTHAIAVPPALALGAWASRPISRRAGTAVAVLAGGTVLAIVLGLRISSVAWLAPPLMATARAANDGPDAATVLRLTAAALAWSLIPLLGYWWLRATRRP